MNLDSGRDQPKQMANKLPVMSVSSSDSSLDNKIPTSSPYPSAFKRIPPYLINIYTKLYDVFI